MEKRVFRCDNCGFECDRDLNASLNLQQTSKP
ncbi:MAG: zinc ribbon domain-containing protein [Coleofasciculus sp. A1-SPW-01]|nr:transposase [Coleofasciculus chthonoplastes]